MIAQQSSTSWVGPIAQDGSASIQTARSLARTGLHKARTTMLALILCAVIGVIQSHTRLEQVSGTTLRF